MHDERSADGRPRRPTVRVAVVQDAPVVFDLDASLDKLEELTRRASERAADLVLFPEAFVSGYPQGMTFGATLGSRSEEGRDQFRRYFASAVEVPGAATQRIGDIACACEVELVVGVTERDGGTLYCTTLFFGPDGDAESTAS